MICIIEKKTSNLPFFMLKLVNLKIEFLNFDFFFIFIMNYFSWDKFRDECDVDNIQYRYLSEMIFFFSFSFHFHT